MVATVTESRASYCPVLELLGLGEKPLDEEYIQGLIRQARRWNPDSPIIEDKGYIPLTGATSDIDGLVVLQKVVPLGDGTFALEDETVRFVRGEIVQILPPDFEI